MSHSSQTSNSPPDTTCAECGTLLPGPGAPCLRCLLSLGDAGGMMFESEPDLLDGAQARSFGDYELIEELARGGMGVVYRARQRSLQRDVALKLMLSGELSSVGARRMFQTEALAAASLHHPHIIAVHDTGECDLQPFIAMHLVPGGRNIAKWAAEHREAGAWPLIAQRAALIARAVAHAHERGVLHRDLKPSNILWDDATGPQVTDFGLAKILSAAGDQATLTAQMIGSPGYMAPEQAGGGGEVTTLTDVYGLGAVLYELLSGRPPFSGESALHTVRMVREEAPAPLMNVPRDLATVCFKCLARLPGDRYGSALAVAEELERFARGEPVLAVPLPVLQKLWRWVKRKPGVAALLSVSTLAVIGGVSGIVWQWRKAEVARHSQAAALHSAETANAAQREAIHHLRWQEMDNHLDRGEAARALARAAAFVRENPDDWRAAMFGMSIVDRHSFPVLAAPEITTLTAKAVAARMSPDGRWIVHAGMDRTVRVFDARSGREVASFLQPPTTPSTDGKPAQVVDITAIGMGSGPHPLAVATGEGQLTLRPLPEGSPAVMLRESKSGSTFWELVFSADGSRLMGRTNSSIKVWNLTASVTEPLQINLTGGFAGAAFSRDGRTVAGWNNERAAVWDAVTGERIMPLFTGRSPSQVALSGDSKYVVLADGAKRVKVWDLTTRTALPGAGRYRGELAALNDDGSRLMTAGAGSIITLHDTASSLPVAENLWPHKIVTHFSSRFPLPIPWLVTSQDGRTFASTGIDNTVNLWDAATGRMLCSPLRLGQGPDYSTFHLTPDAERWLTHSRVFHAAAPAESRLAVWRRTRTAEPVRNRVEDSVFSAAVLSPNGKLGAASRSSQSSQNDCAVIVTEFATGKVLLDEPCEDFARVLMFSPDCRRLYVLSGRTPPLLTAWSLESHEKLWNLPPGPGLSQCADLSRDGTLIATTTGQPGMQEDELVLVNAADGKPQHRIPQKQAINIIRFAPDDSGRLLTAGSQSTARVWDSRTGNLLLTFPQDANAPFNTASWSPDTRRVAAASESTVRIWDAQSGQDTGIRFTAAGWIAHLVFSPDGQKIAVTCRDGTHCVWDASTGQPLWPARRQGESGESIHFLPDGDTFVVQDTRGFRYWSTARGEPVTAHYPAPWSGVGTVDCPGFRAVLAPDGGKIFTGNLASETALWTIPLPHGTAPAWFPNFLEALAMMRENADSTASLVHGRTIVPVREAIAQAPQDDLFAAWARRVLGD